MVIFRILNPYTKCRLWWMKRPQWRFLEWRMNWTRLIRQCRFAFKDYWLHIAAMTGLGFISGMMDGIGINALIPLFSLAVGGISSGDDVITRSIKWFFSFVGVPFNVGYLLIFVSILFILKTVISVISTYVNLKITAAYEENVRNELFGSMLKSRWIFLAKQKLGHLHTLLMLNTQYASSILGKVGSVFMALASLAVYIAVAINISFNVTLVTLGAGIVTFAAFRLLTGRIRFVSDKLQELNKNISHHINQTVMGMKTIKAMDIGDSFASEGRNNFRDLKESQVKIGLFDAINGSLLTPMSVVLVCAVFFLSYRQPEFNFAAMVAIVYLIKQIFSYIEQLQKKLFVVDISLPFLESISLYKEATENVIEGETGNESFRFLERLEFKDITAGYKVGEPVLKKVNFSLKRGSLLGVIGPSGSGKTTIVDLMLRLLEPFEGEILLDGKPAKAISLSMWRRKIGYVSQDIFLTNDTILNNIKFYDCSISDTDVFAAAKKANIYDFAETLPQKWNTVIGDRGVLLSAGQRQRIAIARVLARKPEVLIFDEATSALDNESEGKIQEAISQLRGKVTMIVVAHRLSTVSGADGLLVVKDGGVFYDERPAAELLKDKSSYFYQMHHLKK